jgi:translation elongation factor EF-G
MLSLNTKNLNEYGLNNNDNNINNNNNNNSFIGFGRIYSGVLKRGSEVLIINRDNIIK